MRRWMMAAAGALAAGFWATAAPAQEPPSGVYPPEDAAADDPEFAAYRARLVLAAKRRDVDALLALSDPEIRLSFGGDAGHKDLRRILATPDFDAWANLIFALENGVTRDEDGRYSAPYWFNLQTESPYDPYFTAFVPAWNVRLRAGPSIESEILGAISYEFVVLREPYVDLREDGFQAVRTADGTEGFIHGSYLRVIVDFRAGFERGPEGWRMTFFLAGD